MLVIVILLQVLGNAAIGHFGLKTLIHELIVLRRLAAHRANRHAVWALGRVLNRVPLYGGELAILAADEVARAFDRRFEGVFGILLVTVDVLPHDDGIIDQEPEDHDEREE